MDILQITYIGIYNEENTQRRIHGEIYIKAHKEI